jgi:hypothetical protein
MSYQECDTKEGGEVKFFRAKEGFHIGQEGEFLLHDSFNRPIEKVKGKIVSLMEGKTSSLYVMILTDRGMRPGRLF